MTLSSISKASVTVSVVNAKIPLVPAGHVNDMNIYSITDKRRESTAFGTARSINRYEDKENLLVLLHSFSKAART